MNKQKEDIAAIEKLIQDWRAGWISGDSNALLALYADNPVLMPQSQPSVVGKDAIGLIYQAVFEEYDFEGDGELLEVEVCNNWGYFWSTYTVTAKPKSGGDSVQDKGKSVFIVKRQPDNSWKISRLISNSDLAPAVEK